VLTLGDPVEVQLVEASPVTGPIFELLEGGRIARARERGRRRPGSLPRPDHRSKRGRKPPMCKRR
jgi:hypothetical protein